MAIKYAKATPFFYPFPSWRGVAAARPDEASDLCIRPDCYFTNKWLPHNITVLWLSKIK